MTTTTFRFDERTDALIERLMDAYGTPSKAELIRKALALLEMVQKENQQKRDLAFVDLSNTDQPKIVTVKLL